MGTHYNAIKSAVDEKGRFTRKEKFDQLAEQLGLKVCPPCEPRYNIAPSQMVMCIRTNPETLDREFKELKWELVHECKPEPCHCLGNKEYPTLLDQMHPPVPRLTETT